MQEKRPPPGSLKTNWTSSLELLSKMLFSRAVPLVSFGSYRTVAVPDAPRNPLT